VAPSVSSCLFEDLRHLQLPPVCLEICKVATKLIVTLCACVHVCVCVSVHASIRGHNRVLFLLRQLSRAVAIDWVKSVLNVASILNVASTDVVVLSGVSLASSCQ